MDIRSVLKSTNLFRDVDDGDLRTISDTGEVKEYKKGDLLFAEDDEGKEFYIVAKGSIAINKNVAGGRKRNLSNIITGEVFGELALFDAEPRSADAEAVEDSTVVVLPNDKFLELLNSKPALAATIQKEIIEILCKRLRDTNDLLNEGVIWGFTMDF